MVTLRHFTKTDGPVLQQQYMNMTQVEIENAVRDSSEKRYGGKYFEMFAVEANGEFVGTVSIFQHTSSVISCGPDIFPAFRRRGYAFQAVSLALKHTKSLGYKIAVAQVRKNNAASIALHRKLGFEIDHDYVNSKGNEVFFLIKAI